MRRSTAPLRLRPLFLTLPVALTATHGNAEPSYELPTIAVEESALRAAFDGTTIDSDQLRWRRAISSDSATLLKDVPGVSLYGAGGVSSLPVIHGLADDRLRIKLDGMDLIAACPNHMNPVLSYIDPTQVGSIRVYAGVAPVSVGGDSIGGAIVAETAEPKFAAPGEGSLTAADVGTFYRSNGNARGANLAATYATEAVSLSYSGATAEADNYDAGGNYKNFVISGIAPYVEPDEVGSTAYETRNHTLGVAIRHANHLAEAKFGYQDLPHQLYPNQRMDMLDNEQKRLNLRYRGQFDWGAFDARAYHEEVDHFMDFGQDKVYNYGALMPPNTTGATYLVNGMPMYTEGKTDGVSLRGDIDLGAPDLLRIGLDLQQYRLDDWWPPAPNCGVGNCVGGMAPLTFWNINDGERDRLGLFAEWEARWTPQWLSLVGIRSERVETDTGPVVGYNTSTTPLSMGFMKNMYEASSVGTRADFNAMDRSRTDHNLDLSAIARYTPDANLTFEFGLAQQTRSPNLYERYSWSRNVMALEMNNFVGDGNGYLGNPNLDPEVAHTLSITGEWHSSDGEYQARVTPYYTRVKDYIDAVQWNASTNLPANPVVPGQFVVMKYENQQARLYGVDVSGKMPLGKTPIGTFGLTGLVNYTDGENTDTHDDLYNIMPLNARVSLTHQYGGWDNALEWVGVKGKEEVSDARNEIKTPGYGLVNLRSGHAWQKLRVDVGVENLFDRMYYLPLGGAYVGEGATMSFNKEAGNVARSGMGLSGTQSMWGTAVPGMGRSIYAGISYSF